nr:unnamed protein product [Bacillus phage SPP1]
MNHTDNPIISVVQTIKGGRTMKFYEINDPYYALIKAKDVADAEGFTTSIFLTRTITKIFKTMKSEKWNETMRLLSIRKQRVKMESRCLTPIFQGLSTTLKLKSLSWTVRFYEHSIQS